MLNEIEIKVKKKIEDTTKDASNKDTNEIKEINDITIDSDEELVTLNITDQEGHIIYSYILRFTREGNGVTIGSDSDSGKKVVENVQDTNVSSIDSNESEEEEDTNVSSSDSGNESESDSDSNESEEKEVMKRQQGTNESASASNESEEEEDEKYFGGEIKRDSINDQYTIPTTVLTAKMNEPFTINDNTFIISN